jgi:hypothetical protein
MAFAAGRPCHSNPRKYQENIIFLEILRLRGCAISFDIEFDVPAGANLVWNFYNPFTMVLLMATEVTVAIRCLAPPNFTPAVGYKVQISTSLRSLFYTMRCRNLLLLIWNAIFPRLSKRTRLCVMDHRPRYLSSLCTPLQPIKSIFAVMLPTESYCMCNLHERSLALFNQFHELDVTAEMNLVRVVHLVV